MTIKNSLVKITGSVGAISGVSELNLEGCKIFTPFGAIFGAAETNYLKGVVDGSTRELVQNMIILPTDADDDDCLGFYNVGVPTKVSFDMVGDLSYLPSLQYSLDGKNWKGYTYGYKINLSGLGSHVLFKASQTADNAKFSTDANNYIHFTSTDSVAAIGNVMSLLSKDMSRTDVPAHCFQNLFMGCSGLVTAPALPATTLGDYCYAGMFKACDHLAAAPELPATTLSNNCYVEMFRNCRALTATPELPAATLTDHCYYQMFYGCTNLSKVAVAFTDWNEGQFSTTNWLYRVSDSGTFSCPSTLDRTKTGASYIPSAWSSGLGSDPLCFTAEEAGAVVKFSIVGTISEVYLPSISYSLDGIFWNAYTFGDEITLPAIGDKVYFRATTSNNNFNTRGGLSNFITFSSTAKVAGSGDIMSLLDATSYPTTTNNYAFYHLFYNCTTLTSAPRLSATALGQYCYESMFNGCTNLKEAPELPATTMAKGCYKDMFKGCSNITKAPNLPAKTLAESCYESMFYYCTGLTSAPINLPAQTLEVGCYKDMFAFCFKLKVAPALPAKNLASMCYLGMFYRCTSLITPPSLPATRLLIECYYGMFEDCTSLTSAPALPATTMSEQCYSHMFDGCENLVTAPELPATTTTKECYTYMFNGCKKINAIKVGFSAWLKDDYNVCDTYGWLHGVSGTGTFYGPSDLDQTQRGEDYIPTNWTVNPSYFKPENCLYFTSDHDEAEVRFDIVGTLTTTPSLLYSTDDGSSWSPYNFGTKIILNNAGDKVYFMAKGKNATFSKESKNHIQFVCYGQVKAYGNIMSLLDNTCEQTSVPSQAFNSLFMNSDLVVAPELPATELGDDCYFQMFRGCNIVAAPELPATQLGEYSYCSMFHTCTHLITAPTILPAETLKDNCYADMFFGCTQLKTSPDIKATSLEEIGNSMECMFEGCTSLKEVKVNFTEWNDNGENTDFWLKNVASSGIFYCPAGLETTTRDNSRVPEGWTVKVARNMTKADACLYFVAEEAGIEVGFDATGTFTNMPKLVASTNDGATWYDYSFGERIALGKGSKVYFMALDKNTTFTLPGKYITFASTGKVSANGSIMSLLDNTCNQTSVPDYAFQELFASCTGLIKAPELPATTLGILCYNEMFYCCSNLVTAPTILPAPTLTQGCYASMFGGCSSLQKAPELPAETLVDGCYDEMFINCTSLNSVTVGFTDWNAADGTNDWLYNVASTGTFNCSIELDMPAARGSSTIPVGWNVSYTDATDILGDVNGDGRVTVADVTCLIKYLSGASLRRFNTAVADVNDNGTIGAEDIEALITIVLSE